VPQKVKRVEDLIATAVQDQEAAVKRRNHALAHTSVANAQGNNLGKYNFHGKNFK
jgi:hypothetical protein